MIKPIILLGNNKLYEKSVEISKSEPELLQHEYDHLDGILATMRAVDSKSFYIKNTKEAI